MKPVMSRAQLDRITAAMPDVMRDQVAANVEVYPDAPARVINHDLLRQLVHISPPPRWSLSDGRIQVDQERIKNRFLELLAEQQGMVPSERARPAPRQRGAAPAFTAVDEAADQVLARGKAIVERLNGARQAGKTAEMQRWADEMERVTGVRPTTVSVHRSPGQEMPQPWKKAGYTSGGGQVWTAPVGTPVPDPLDRWTSKSKEPMTPAEAAALAQWTAERSPAQREADQRPAQWLDVDEVTGEVFADTGWRDRFRRERLNMWQQEEPDPARLRELRATARAAVEELADRSGTPQHLLPLDDDYV